MNIVDSDDKDKSKVEMKVNWTADDVDEIDNLGLNWWENFVNPTLTLHDKIFTQPSMSVNLFTQPISLRYQPLCKKLMASKLNFME